MKRVTAIIGSIAVVVGTGSCLPIGGQQNPGPCRTTPPTQTAGASAVSAGTPATVSVSPTGGDLLVAYVAGSEPDGGVPAQTSAVTSTGSLVWHLAVRENTWDGVSEIWWATGMAGTFTVTDTPAVTAVTPGANTNKGTPTDALYVAEYRGASGIGATGQNAASGGAPTVSLVASQTNSLVYGTGFDWASATPRTIGSGQTMLADSHNSDGTDAWFQFSQAPTAAGATTTLSDTAPVSDRFDMTAAEILGTTTCGGSGGPTTTMPPSTVPPTTVPRTTVPPTTVPPTTVPPTTAPPTTPPVTAPPSTGGIGETGAGTGAALVCPSGAVAVSPGAVPAFQPNTAYCFAAGTYAGFSAGSVPAGTGFYGQGKAVLDGGGSVASAFVESGQSNITIDGFTMQHYASSTQYQSPAVVDFFSGTGLRVSDNSIENDQTTGVRFGGETCCYASDYGVGPHNSTISHNLIANIGYSGTICSGCLNDTIDHNEISGTNTFGSNSEDDVAALGKLASSSGVDINNNWVHDNADTALWADIGNTAFTIDHNTLGPNDRVGAFWEISCSMSITNNLIQGEGAFDAGHGLGAPGSGIRISSSNPNDNSCTSAGFQMLVSGNTLSGNHEGITLYDGHGPSVPVAGATVSGNQVTVTDTGSDAWQAYDANSNSFVGNTYRGNNNFNPGGNFAGWRSSGRDTTGSYTS